MPERIQMSRQRPWRAEHPDAVIIDRTTKYGNPFTIKRERCEEGPKDWCWVVRRAPRRYTVQHFDTEDESRAYAVTVFRQMLVAGQLDFTVEDLHRDLRGRDVACWCATSKKCHGDPILELANLLLCPECAQGKTGNCIGWTLDADDNEVACETSHGNGTAS